MESSKNKSDDGSTKNLYNEEIKNEDNIYNDNVDLSSNESSLNTVYEEQYVLQLNDLKPFYYPINPNSFFGYTYYFDIHVYLLSKL